MTGTMFPLINRRTLFLSSAATAALATSAQAALPRQNGSPIPNKVALRGHVGRHERLPRLDLESQQDFLEGFRVWVNSDLQTAAEKRIAEIMQAKGIDPNTAVPQEVVLANVAKDPLVALQPHNWLRVQQLMWKTLHTHFHSMHDQYLAEMASADKIGPGKLELNPDLDIPVYTAHEIHMQPGGYVGDPFAGHIYHHGTNEFFNGKNYQDETHEARAASVRLPPDGKVQRILELGTGIGQLPIALKRRFPQAEVWGIDVGGPMVRYAHMRAVDLGVDVNFAQRLAEDSKFPDGYFDVVTSMQFFHEITAEAAVKVCQEVHRILRPGGVFYPLDGNPTTRPKTAANIFRNFWIYRWNHEDWQMEWLSIDLMAEMQKAGFQIDPSTGRNGENILGIKA